MKNLLTIKFPFIKETIKEAFALYKKTFLNVVILLLSGFMGSAILMWCGNFVGEKVSPSIFMGVSLLTALLIFCVQAITVAVIIKIVLKGRKIIEAIKLVIAPKNLISFIWVAILGVSASLLISLVFGVASEFFGWIVYSPILAVLIKAVGMVLSILISSFLCFSVLSYFDEKKKGMLAILNSIRIAKKYWKEVFVLLTLIIGIFWVLTNSFEFLGEFWASILQSVSILVLLAGVIPFALSLWVSAYKNIKEKAGEISTEIHKKDKKIIAMIYTALVIDVVIILALAFYAFIFFSAMK